MTSFPTDSNVNCTVDLDGNEVLETEVATISIGSGNNLTESVSNDITSILEFDENLKVVKQESTSRNSSCLASDPMLCSSAEIHQDLLSENNVQGELCTDIDNIQSSIEEHIIELPNIIETCLDSPDVSNILPSDLTTSLLQELCPLDLDVPQGSQSSSFIVESQTPGVDASPSLRKLEFREEQYTKPPDGIQQPTVDDPISSIINPTRSDDPASPIIDFIAIDTPNDSDEGDFLSQPTSSSTKISSFSDTIIRILDDCSDDDDNDDDDDVFDRPNVKLDEVVIQDVGTDFTGAGTSTLQGQSMYKQAIRKELRCKIHLLQERRARHPQRICAADNLSSPINELVEAQLRKKKRNREHAKKSRERAKDERKKLVMSKEELEKTNEMLVSKNELLENNYKSADTWLHLHDSCQVQETSPASTNTSKLPKKIVNAIVSNQELFQTESERINTLSYSETSRDSGIVESASENTLVTLPPTNSKSICTLTFSEESRDSHNVESENNSIELSPTKSKSISDTPIVYSPNTHNVQNPHQSSKFDLNKSIDKQTAIYLSQPTHTNDELTTVTEDNVLSKSLHNWILDNDGLSFDGIEIEQTSSWEVPPRELKKTKSLNTLTSTMSAPCSGKQIYQNVDIPVLPTSPSYCGDSIHSRKELHPPLHISTSPFSSPYYRSPSKSGKYLHQTLHISSSSVSSSYPSREDLHKSLNISTPPSYSPYYRSPSQSGKDLDRTLHIFTSPASSSYPSREDLHKSLNISTPPSYSPYYRSPSQSGKDIDQTLHIVTSPVSSSYPSREDLHKSLNISTPPSYSPYYRSPSQSGKDLDQALHIVTSPVSSSYQSREDLHKSLNISTSPISSPYSRNPTSPNSQFLCRNPLHCTSHRSPSPISPSLLNSWSLQSPTSSISPPHSINSTSPISPLYPRNPVSTPSISPHPASNRLSSNTDPPQVRFRHTSL